MEPWRSFCSYLVHGRSSDIVACVEKLVKVGKTNDMLQRVKDVHDRSATVNDSYLLRALAVILDVCPDQRSYVLWMLIPDMCETIDKLMEFLSYLPRSWGRTTRRAVESWLLARTPKELAFQMTRYRKRYGMTQKDLLRLVHPRPEFGGFNHMHEYNELFAYITDRWYRPSYANSDPEFHQYLEDLELVRNTTVASNVVPLIIKHKLTKEHVGCQALFKDVNVWNALLQNPMSPIDILQNLKRYLVLFDTKQNVRLVCNHLTRLSDRNIRPLHVLRAQQMLKGLHTSHELQTALQVAFYNAFDTYVPTQKRFFVTLDVSGSMACSPCVGMKDISARQASALLAMSFVRKEQSVRVHAFSDGLRELPLGSEDNYESIMDKISRLSFDDTDCNAPILYALQNNIVVDCFVIITDSEVNEARDALLQYQERVNPDSKLVIVATSLAREGLCDDNVMMIVGMDPYAFDVIQTFTRGCV